MKFTLKLTLILFISVLSLSCTNKSKTTPDKNLGKITVVSPSEFKEKSIDQTIIDIRTTREFSQGHIEGAVNINYYDRKFLEKVSQFDKNKPIFIYCRSGSRTSSASKKLAKNGFKQVYDLQGGIMHWVRSNNKIVK